MCRCGGRTWRLPSDRDVSCRALAYEPRKSSICVASLCRRDFRISDGNGPNGGLFLTGSRNSLMRVGTLGRTLCRSLWWPVEIHSTLDRDSRPLRVVSQRLHMTFKLGVGWRVSSSQQPEVPVVGILKAKATPIVGSQLRVHALGVKMSG